MNAPLLHLDQISRRYGAVTALHPVNLDIPAGARHAIIGPNGAGKSTLLNLIAGSQRPSDGTITLDNKPITRLAAATRARHGIGRTFQHPAVNGQQTPPDNHAHAPHTPPRSAPRLDVPKRLRRAATDAQDRLDSLRQEQPAVVYGVLAGVAVLIAVIGVLIVRAARR